MLYVIVVRPSGIRQGHKSEETYHELQPRNRIKVLRIIKTANYFNRNHPTKIFNYGTQKLDLGEAKSVKAVQIKPSTGAPLQSEPAFSQRCEEATGNERMNGPIAIVVHDEAHDIALTVAVSGKCLPTFLNSGRYSGGEKHSGRVLEDETEKKCQQHLAIIVVILRAFLASCSLNSFLGSTCTTWKQSDTCFVGFGSERKSTKEKWKKDDCYYCDFYLGLTG